MTPGQGFLGAVARVWARVTNAPAVGGGMSIMPFGNVLAGVRLNDPQEALKAAAVWRCVNLLSQTIAMLPWQVFKRDDEGNGTRQANNPVEWLLSHGASDELTAFDFKRSITAHRMLYGNGYAEIERTTRGTPFALHLLDPTRVTPGRTAGGTLAYKVSQPAGESIVMPAADIFHVRGLAFDGVRGYSVLDVAARSIATGMAMDEFSERFFAQGMRPAGFLKTKGKMGGDALKNVVKFIAENYQGAKNMWKPIPLDADMEWQETQSSMEDAQFVDLRKFNVIDICRWFGVPPHMAFDLDKATFSNIESQGQEFLNYGLLPAIVPMEQETDRKLLSSNWGGLYSKMNVNAIVRGDMTARGSFYQIMRNTGSFSVNDILRREDMPTIGKEGDVRVMQAQYLPIGKDGVPIKPEPPPPPPAPPADPNAPDDPNADPAPPPAAKPPAARRANGAAH